MIVNDPLYHKKKKLGILHNKITDFLRDIYIFFDIRYINRSVQKVLGYDKYGVTQFIIFDMLEVSGVDIYSILHVEEMIETHQYLKMLQETIAHNTFEFTEMIEFNNAIIVSADIIKILNHVQDVIYEIEERYKYYINHIKKYYVF